MALILTGQFTPEQAQPPEPDIHAEVKFQHVKVLHATGYVVLDGATPELRLQANTFDDGVVQIGMLINYGRGAERTWLVPPAGGYGALRRQGFAVRR